ncbi:MAG TPA: glycosyl hydrolase family 65 protein [Kofleriaceae bacterium]|nr:glycosyl hydrolase family 65 protein [Kofleriaceae bacterium]
MKGWELVYEGYEPMQEGVRETLCTLGNGYFATRGAAHDAAGGVHYAGTYITGCYNRLSTEIDGRLLEHEDLVNMPNWLLLTYRHAGGEPFELATTEILSYRQTLDLRRGIVTRDVRVRDRKGCTTRITSTWIVHMADPHVAALEVVLTAEDWSGPIEIRAALDGWVQNRGVEIYRLLASQHLAPIDSRAVGEDSVLLEMETVRSHIRIAEAARTRVFDGDRPYAHGSAAITRPGFAARELSLELPKNRPIRIEKVVAIYTSRDFAIAAPDIAATERIAAVPTFATLVESHVLAWERLWRAFDICVEVAGTSEPSTGVILRLHVFHLLQTASEHSADLDAGVGARGLHGEAYRGHVFWDELFIFPLLNTRMADITRALLMYRYRRLAAARRAARREGYRGAMYPWQSGSDGREETPLQYFNPRSGRWIVDNTHLQRHVGAAIAYNVWQYFQVTGDVDFLGDIGAEMFLEIARFVASLATYVPERGRFEIRGVVGPDEFHTAYPGAHEPGLDNNAYTNVMSVWMLWRARDVLDALPRDRRHDVCKKLALGDDELVRWDEISRKMWLPFLDGGILAQFEGYDRLLELDWADYRARYGNIQRLDLILESEGDSPNRYKASKQADVLMLYYLFSSEELRTLFERLGYPFDPSAIPRTIDYYLRRTSDGSTLSRVVHAWVLARSRRAGSWQIARDALASDIRDIQNGTTREGIHLGAMAGSVDLIQRGYTGLELREGVIWINPRLPDPVERLDVLVRYRGHTLELTIWGDVLEVKAIEAAIPTIKLGVLGTVIELRAGERRRFALREAQS